MKRRLLTLVLVAGLAAAAYYVYSRPPSALVLTGIVTTHEVVVSPQIGGKIDQLPVAEGDQVRKGQLLAVIPPDELMAESAYYEQSAAGLSSQVHESEAALRFQRRQTIDQTRAGGSTLPSTESQVMAASADLENARLTFSRTENLSRQGVVSSQ